MLRSAVFSAALIAFSIQNAVSSTSTSLYSRKDIEKFFNLYNVKSYNKCGFHILAHYFSLPSAEPTLKTVLQARPITDTSIVRGHFRIHFDTTNANGSQPFLYDSSGHIIAGSTMAFVDTVAEICNYVYHIEVDSLGFPPPPAGSNMGGGNEYDIYIQSLPAGEYGYTDWDESSPLVGNRENPTYAAWTVIRNEYQSTYTRGVPAMEVTIAHEFHHGIQIGNYGLWQNDLWFYELTSTWMEQVVYPSIKDYYQYLQNFFDNVDLPFNSYDPNTYAGYERCVFGIFVQNEFKDLGGAGVMKGIWNNIAHEPVIQSIEDEFKSIGIDPSYVFQLFAQWNYFTNYRSSMASQYGVLTYPNANVYPLVKISGFDDLTSVGVKFSAAALRLTEHFYRINVGTDTIGIGVVNNNFEAAANYDTSSFPFSVGISANGFDCIRKLSNGYCIFFTTADRENWRLVPSVTGADTNLVVQNNVAFPQPFDPLSQYGLRIPYPFSNESEASLSVLDISGELIDKLGSDKVAQFLGGKYFIWNGRDRTGKIVPSGIYIYVISDGTRNVTGKIAVVKN
jgi:hypothetical protein